jgi:hypothetical protein
LRGREILLPESRASLVWVLDALRCAPLLHLRSEEHRSTVLADIGMGNVLHVEITKYAGEKPAPVRLWSSSAESDVTTLDGRDVRVTWRRRFEPLLAAPGPVSTGPTR